MLSKLVGLKQVKQKREAEYEAQINVALILKEVQHVNIKKGEELVKISQKQFVTLCRLGRSALLSQPSFLRLNCPMIIATGTLGHYDDLASIFKCGSPRNFNYLFLGDYVGRGKKSIQCLVALICNKILYPQNFFMLRGCMDSIAATRCNLFYEQCLNRYSPKAWTEACEFLCSLPFAAVIQNQIFCVHGGPSPELASLDEINKIPRPLQTPEVGIPCDLVWSDPSINEDALLWTKNTRGFGFCWNEKAAKEFLDNNCLSLLCRGHEIVLDGFQYSKDKQVATICSLANYCGFYNNSAAVLNVDSQMNVYFRVVKERTFFPIQANPDSPEAYLENVARQKRRIKKQKQQELIKKKLEQEKLEEQNRKKKEEEEKRAIEQKKAREAAQESRRARAGDGKKKGLQKFAIPEIMERPDSQDEPQSHFSTMREPHKQTLQDIRLLTNKVFAYQLDNEASSDDDKI